jgi:hypothetical protein
MIVSRPSPKVALPTANDLVIGLAAKRHERAKGSID